METPSMLIANQRENIAQVYQTTYLTKIVGIESGDMSQKYKKIRAKSSN